ncbi:MAG: sulfite exporter TauE/SafE family protein [Bryobacteraceae bacterium]
MILGSVLSLLLATLIGLSLGVLGSGGSIITLPMLVYAAGVPAAEAVGMSMAIVGATSLLGAVIQWRKGNVVPRIAIIFSLGGMIGSYLGSTGTHLLSKQLLMLLFSGVMLVVGFLMLRGYGLQGGQACNVRRCVIAGFAVGVLTGFIGVGGGFLIVPALLFFAGLPQRTAAGTSLAVIAFNSATGLIGQLRYVSMDWSALGGFLFFAFAGMLAGLAVANRLDEKALRKLFGIALIVLALVLGFLNF